MEKSNDSFGDEEDYSCELPNFDLKFFAGPQLKTFANFKQGGAESAG